MCKNHHHKGKGCADGAVDPAKKGLLPPEVVLRQGKIVKNTARKINYGQDIAKEKDLIRHCTDKYTEAKKNKKNKGKFPEKAGLHLSTVFKKLTKNDVDAWDFHDYLKHKSVYDIKFLEDAFEIGVFERFC